MVLETERLYLQSPDCVKGQQLLDYWVRNREFLEEFEPRRPEEYFTLPYQEDQLRQQQKGQEQGQSYRFYLSPKENRELIIGSIGLNNIVMGPFCSCFMGYQLDKAYLNRGFMTEAVNAAVRYGFEQLGLHRIEGNIMPRNTASIRVVEKCGFVREGLSRKYLKINGVWEDHVHYVKLNEEME